jgi:hypothetical protein
MAFSFVQNINLDSRVWPAAAASLCKIAQPDKWFTKLVDRKVIARFGFRRLFRVGSFIQSPSYHRRVLAHGSRPRGPVQNAGGGHAVRALSPPDQTSNCSSCPDVQAAAGRRCVPDRLQRKGRKAFVSCSGLSERMVSVMQEDRALGEGRRPSTQFRHLALRAASSFASI